MKVGFFTEGGFEGKIPKEYNNMRTDAAWMYLTDATHHPLFKINTSLLNVFFALRIARTVNRIMNLNRIGQVICL